MNPRHAAALALVGWYLMVPPRAQDGSPNIRAPLSEWNQASIGFDTASECSKARNQEALWVVRNLNVVEQEIEALPDSGNQPLSKVTPKTYDRHAHTLSTANAFMYTRDASRPTIRASREIGA
jgi:hypothetical protein